MALSIATVGLIITGAVWFPRTAERNGSQLTAKDARLQQEQLAELNQDADNDGLKDWEELLWKTDPKNPDTDGDGTKDNDEVLAKRDPRKAGPDDALTIDTAITGTVTSASDTEGINLTQNLANSFGASYLKRKFSGMDVGENQKEYLSDMVFSAMTEAVGKEVSRAPKVHFSKEDIQISNNNTPDTIKAYINELGTIITSPPKNVEQGAMVTFLTILSQQTDADLYEDTGKWGLLEDHKQNYQYFIDNMSNMTVPGNMADAHIAMMNNFFRTKQIIGSLSNISEDPLTSMAALNLYITESYRSLEPLGSIVDEIKSKNLSFSEEDGGNVFVKYVAFRK